MSVNRQFNQMVPGHTSAASARRIAAWQISINFCSICTLKFKLPTRTIFHCIAAKHASAASRKLATAALDEFEASDKKR